MLNKQFFVTVSILVVAGFLRFFHLSQYPLLPYSNFLMSGDIFISMFTSIVLGLIGILGLYILAKELFSWQIGAIASFLMTISVWHITYSQSGLTYILIPTIFVWTFFFMWYGMRKSHTGSFVVAGILGAAGVYISYSNLWFIAIAILLFLNYWSYLKKDFEYSKYEFARNKLLQGFTILFLTALIILLPTGFNNWQHSNTILAILSNSIFSKIDIFSALTRNVTETLDMFMPTIIVDRSLVTTQLPPISWPICILFIVGFARELAHWFSRKHGHFSTSHTFIFAWFIFMLMPGFLSASSPNQASVIGVLPVIFIFAARGIWWIFDKLNHWEYATHPDKHKLFHGHFAPPILLALWALLMAVSFHELWRYFKLIV